MLKPLWLHLDTIAARIRESERMYVGLDFDGTLAEIVIHPAQADISPRTRIALQRIVALPGVELGMLSGRKLDDLRELIPYPGVFLSGTAGLETLDSRGQRRLHVSPEQALPDRVRESMSEWCGRFEGAWLEDKGPAFAVHYRAVNERFQPAFCSGLRRRFAGEQDRARLLHGKKVFEVLPAIDRDKSHAFAEWVNGDLAAVSFYMGDDAHDEVVYPRVRERGGFAVAIGRYASRAEYALTDPQQVTWFLEWLEREWREAKQLNATSSAATNQAGNAAVTPGTSTNLETSSAGSEATPTTPSGPDAEEPAPVNA